MINASSDRNYLRFQRGVYCGQGNFHNWNVCKYMKWKCTLAVAHFLWSIASVGEKPENDGALIWSTCFLREPPLVATAFIGCLEFIVGRCYNAVASLASSIAVWAQQWLCCSRYASVSLGLVIERFETLCWLSNLLLKVWDAWGFWRLSHKVASESCSCWHLDWWQTLCSFATWLGGSMGILRMKPPCVFRSWFVMSTVSLIPYVVLMVYLICWWYDMCNCM